MARRATLFQSLQATSNTIIVGGGYEFLASETTKPSSTETLSRLSQAFTALEYDLLVLTPAEQIALEQAQVQLAPTWQPQETQTQVITQEVPDGTLAFVLYPTVTDNTPTETTIDSLAQLATDLRTSKAYDLIIGISTWGQTAEESFIAKHGQAFDIILGAGQGSGFAGQYLQDDQLLWVRPSLKGRAINAITLPTLPKPGEKTTWVPDESISTVIYSLDDAIPSDQKLVNILTP